MIEINHLVIYILGSLPMLGLMAFGYFIIRQDRKREKLEEEQSKKTKSH